MKLAVPLSAPGEARILFEAGATEFYCGLQPFEWQARFGDHDSISRRQGKANVATLAELNTLTAEAAVLGAPLFLTVNGNYTQQQLPYALEMAEAFEDMGGAGIMVMDIALLALLKRRGSKLMRGLSLLAVASSCSALAFYMDLGVKRVVFPRFLSPAQMGTILRQYPDMEAEAIVWLDKCKCIDGYCRFLHCVAYPDCSQGQPSCELYSYDTGYKLPACFELFGMPPHAPACGACQLKPLSQAGVSVFKLGGRGRSLDTRLSGTRFLSLTGAMQDDDEIKKHYQKTFGVPCNPGLCYYNKMEV